MSDEENELALLYSVEMLRDLPWLDQLWSLFPNDTRQRGKKTAVQDARIGPQDCDPQISKICGPSSGTKIIRPPVGPARDADHGCVTNEWHNPKYPAPAARLERTLTWEILCLVLKIRCRAAACHRNRNTSRTQTSRIWISSLYLVFRPGYFLALSHYI